MSRVDIQFYQGRRIWVIGASTGIGKALVIELASRGADVIASARNEEALRALSDHSDHISSLPLDVAQEDGIAQAIDKLRESDTMPDTIVFVAAHYEPCAIHGIQPTDLKTTISVNLWAPIELTRLLLPIFYQRKSGQLAFVASVAGYRGLPKGQPYSATKAGLINFAESLYLEARSKGVDVKLVNPGFVETPMTDKNNFTMPEMISTEEAAMHIAEGLSGNEFEIHFPKKFTRKLKLLRTLPYGIFFKLAGKLIPK